ncbi:diguanylate cyclase/phosphodiesterase (GGDEF & EAL domains) with PAS/PAC sensor(s) [Euzebya pacifica]|uniref:Diguanylate cyclase/phosphodiesterase (GGDEF & EAL domains) with PAS/PAC sensor(S) n=1 Tax=Euzebya pacifica TaxID=1608957 RepID=A0A346Y3C0_9ACTN|nr:bifunctional diguanylate cyclase/phosphodiesterase [Euzebya pacifica]AXV08967.1 diguanylate cyclase/phosphodiesterase (GGDEF & EAL domains) with PAS/PAC sensor(s) [Euzebya pacifica]
MEQQRRWLMMMVLGVPVLLSTADPVLLGSAHRAVQVGALLAITAGTAWGAVRHRPTVPAVGAFIAGVVVANAINLALELDSIVLVLVGFASGLGAIGLILRARRPRFRLVTAVDALAVTGAPFTIVALTATTQPLPPDAPTLLVANFVVLLLVVFTICLPYEVSRSLVIGLAAICMSTFADIATLLHHPFTAAGTNFMAAFPLLLLAVTVMHPTFTRVTTPVRLPDQRHRVVRVVLLSGSMAITLLLALSDERLLTDRGVLAVATPMLLAGLITFRMAGWITLLDGEARSQRTRLRTDPLTGLRSPTGLHSFLVDAEVAGPVPGWSMVVVDLDGFRRINDAFGLEGGDATLQAVATTLRAITPPDAGLARLDADEFAIVLPGEDLVRARRVALTAVAAIRELLNTGPTLGRLSLRASAGIAVENDGGAGTIDRLTHRALTAVGHAQQTGKQVLEFDPAMTTEASTDLALLRDLQQALQTGSGQIRPAFQPIVDLRTGRIVAVEALARWVRPDGTAVEPDRYIGLAEASGWIGALGQRMLQLSCEAGVALRRQHPDLRVHVNVSPVEAEQPSFVQATLATIHRSGLPLDAVVLEVTEQVFLPRSGAALDAFLTLAGEGVALALDDFGSGYASVGYLSRLPLAYIKIDKSFTAELGSEGALLEDLMPFLRARGPVIIAEGVETDVHLRNLERLGCALGQGWLLGRPILPLEPDGDPATILGLAVAQRFGTS